MKILCIIVVYKPNMISLMENIQNLIGEVEKVLVWQNSELQDNEVRNLLSIFDNKKIAIVGNGINEGIPAALNYAVNHLTEYNCDYLLTMDQDSCWVNFRKYKTFVEREARDRIYGPEIIPNTELNFDASESKELEIEEAGYVITSGMLCHQKTLIKIGLFKEDLFIDAVDEEYCYRARKKGIKSVRVQGAYLKQQFGESKVVSFIGKKTIVSNYSPFRYYYIVRNHIYLLRTNLPNKEERRSIFINYIRAPIIKCALFERNKIEKLRMITRGIFAGMKMTLPEE